MLIFYLTKKKKKKKREKGEGKKKRFAFIWISTKINLPNISIKNCIGPLAHENFVVIDGSRSIFPKVWSDPVVGMGPTRAYIPPHNTWLYTFTKITPI